MTTQTAPPSYTPPVSAGADNAFCEALQDAVVLIVDLQLQGKQAHWNVVGRSFRSLHTHLDDIVDLARDAADTFAERMRALGSYPDARVGVVASTSTLLAASEGPRPTRRGGPCGQHPATPGGGGAASRARCRPDAGPPTAGLINQVVVDVEKHAWMLEARVAAQGTDPS